MKKKMPEGAVETTLYMVGDKWKFLIVRELLQGTKRFGEIKAGLESITQKVLTQNLRDLEERGLLKRKVYAQVPPKVEYSLTKTGETLKPVIDSMTNWGNHYRAKKLKLDVIPEDIEIEILDETPEVPREKDEKPRPRKEMDRYLL